MGPWVIIAGGPVLAAPIGIQALIHIRFAERAGPGENTATFEAPLVVHAGAKVLAGRRDTLVKVIHTGRALPLGGAVAGEVAGKVGAGASISTGGSSGTLVHVGGTIEAFPLGRAGAVIGGAVVVAGASVLAVVWITGISVGLTQGSSIASRARAIVVAGVVVGGASIQAQGEGAVVVRIGASVALVTHSTRAGKVAREVVTGGAIETAPVGSKTLVDIGLTVGPLVVAGAGAAVVSC